mmetsp:Transcript_6097/g.11655  ORF Transcript_6097/g.11655 Transcript_6097/m.11655 type:complete len:174 (-) Transcript_6097:238-759(-)
MKPSMAILGAPCHVLSDLFPQPSSHVNPSFMPSFPSPYPSPSTFTPKDVSRIFVDKYLASSLPKYRKKISSRRAYKTPHQTKPVSSSYWSGPLVKKIKVEKGVSNYPLLSPERMIVKTEVDATAEAVQSPCASPTLQYVSEEDGQFQHHSRDLDSNESLSDMEENAEFFSGWL